VLDDQAQSPLVQPDPADGGVESLSIPLTVRKRGAVGHRALAVHGPYPGAQPQLGDLADVQFRELARLDHPGIESRLDRRRLVHLSW
jgi:hypothetical protein